MARKRSLSSIENELTKTEEEYRRLYERCTTLEKRLKQLRNERDRAEGEKIVQALKKSGKTYRQLMTFLGC
ncbi:MAG: hypothetical protein ACI3ZF_01490 [Candidatus Cryptobacteroides sp.]